MNNRYAKPAASARQPSNPIGTTYCTIVTDRLLFQPPPCAEITSSTITKQITAVITPMDKATIS